MVVFSVLQEGLDYKIGVFFQGSGYNRRGRKILGGPHPLFSDYSLLLTLYSKS